MAQYSTEKQTLLNWNKTIFEVGMMADKDGNIINSFGVASNVPIANGDVVGWDALRKFGAVPGMSVNTTGSIWDINDTLYPWDTIDNSGSGRTLTITVTNPSTGNPATTEDGKPIVIIGLDANLDEIQESITISGSSGTGSSTFRRVFRAYVDDGVNTSDVNILSNGTPVARISANKGQTLMAIYTIPNGKTGFLGSFSASAQYGSDATIDFFVRYGGQGAFRLIHSNEISGAGGQYKYEYGVPIKVQAGSDLDMQATSRANNGRYSAAFELLIVDNDYL